MIIFKGILKMKVKPSDLYVRQENTSFAIYVDPFNGEWFFDKKRKTISKYPSELNSLELEAQNKTEAKRKIIELL